MFSDTDYINKARDLIITERQRLYELYSKSSRFKAYQPTANFILLKILDESTSAEQLFDQAIRQNMMIRDCSTFPFLSDRYIRICFMDPEDNDRLYQCLNA
jgi:threonine-phosphate decarboxylase